MNECFLSRKEIIDIYHVAKLIRKKLITNKLNEIHDTAINFYIELINEDINFLSDYLKSSINMSIEHRGFHILLKQNIKRIRINLYHLFLTESELDELLAYIPSSTDKLIIYQDTDINLQKIRDVLPFTSIEYDRR